MHGAKLLKIFIHLNKKWFLVLGETFGFMPFLGLISLYVSGGLMWEGMAVSIMVGLLYSGIITLVFIPLLYSILFKVNYQGYEFNNKLLDD